VAWRKEERPVDWERRFGRLGELQVEIGFGLGDYLIKQAKAFPDKNFVGIEEAWIPVRTALRKIALAGVNNIRIVRADAQVALERLFLQKSLHRVYAIFPCPWPKRKHVKHRLFSLAFLELANNRLVDGGAVSMVTDHQPYFDWVVSQSRGSGFEVYGERVCPHYETKYERKWRALGHQNFFQLRLIKSRHREIPIKGEVNLKTLRLTRFDPEGFQPTGSKGDIVVEFKDRLYDPEQGRVMVRSWVREDHLTQDFWVDILKREEGWIIRPAKGCSLIPTAGVQRALDLLQGSIEAQGRDGSSVHPSVSR